MAKKATVLKNDSVCNCGNCNCGKISKCDGSSAIYGLGFIGAAIYYISTATGFWMGVLGFLKALIWPLFLVWDLLKFLAM